MPSKNNDINEVLDEFAHKLITASNDKTVQFDQKVDAFKALTAYAALRHKMALKGVDLDEDGETTMDELRTVIAGAGEKRNGRRAS